MVGASVALKNVQLDQQGLYTCEAENGIGGSVNITYEVKVYGVYSVGLLIIS